VDDPELLARTRKGDEGAFVELFARHQRAVFRYAVHMCGREAADDIVQEAFLALLRQLDRYDPNRGTLVGYLLGIARHHVFKRLADAQAESWLPLMDDVFGDEVIAAPDEAANPFAGLSRAETIERVRAAVRALPAAYREAVVLCELNELDYAAAAAVIGCPIGTVRSRLHRARALLACSLASSDCCGSPAR